MRINLRNIAKKNLLQRVSFLPRRTNRFSMGFRFISLFISLLILSVGSVGLISFSYSEKMMMDSVENRLERESHFTRDMAQYLKLSYIGEEEKFEDQFQAGVKEQVVHLMQDDLSADFFLVDTEKQIEPFNVNPNSTLPAEQDIISHVFKHDAGILHRDIDGQTYTFSFLPVHDINKHLIVSVPASSYMGPVQDLRQTVLYVVLGSSIISAFIVFISVRKMTKPLRILRQHMRKVREGNLNEEVYIRSSIPEISSLSKSFKLMMTTMRQLIQEIKSTTGHLTTTSQQLSDTSETLNTYNHQLQHAIDTVSEGASETATSSEQSDKVFKRMNESIQNILERVEEVTSSSKDMKQRSSDGEQQISDMISSMDTFSEEVRSVYSTIQHVTEQARHIKQDVSLIQQISEQTKLLSLNATIEASRAGKEGKGFTVVAKEVRNLADQSSQLTSSITESAENMDKISTKAFNEFQYMLTSLEEQMKSATLTKDAFTFLLQKVNETSNRLSNMHQVLNDMSNYIPEVEKVTNHFSSISQETLASTQEMNHISTEQKEFHDQSLSIVKELNEWSLSLEQMIVKFKS